MTLRYPRPPNYHLQEILDTVITANPHQLIDTPLPDTREALWPNIHPSFHCGGNITFVSGFGMKEESGIASVPLEPENEREGTAVTEEPRNESG